ncbi:MAG: penicillin-binding protein 2 [Chloroflexi bacterium]|nr:penicillin-binding protein 2 [Chloroflexota bacterium]
MSTEPQNEYSYTKAVTDEDLKPRGNFRLLRLAILVLFAILALQLANVQIAQGQYYREAANRNRFRLTQTEALRGIIYDRNGKILVRNIPSFSVSIVPADLPDDQQERVFKELSVLLNLPIDTVVENTSSDVVGRMPLALARVVVPPVRKPGLREMIEKGRRDPYSPTLIKTNVPREVAFNLEERHLDFPGLRVDLEPVREYVEGPLLAHLLGYTGLIPSETYDDYRSRGYSPTDQVGLTGLEYTFESDLRGVKGRRYVEVDVTGREVNLRGEELSVAGRNLVLTVDMEFQRTVQKALEKAMQKARAKQAVAIALDPRNGDILAMVSLPSYDNNLFATGISLDDFTNLAQDPLHPLMNQAITGQYPPGSTFKLIPASAALQERVIDLKTRIQTPGIIWVPNKFFPDDLALAQPFYDWYKPGFGSLNILGGLAQSSDVFFYKIAGGEYPEFDTGLNEERLAAYSRMFGLGQLTGIDIPGEAKGLVPDPTWKRKTIGDIWTVGDTYNMGIGQGYVLSTPLQVANYAAIVANGGTLYKPQLVRAVTDAEGRLIQTTEPEVIRRVAVSPQNLAIVREGMRLSTTSGTSVNANLAEVTVAAKTGTAEYYGPKVNGHLPTHAWFTAFAPYENPEIVVTVFVYGGGEGSAVAAPAATDILRAYFKLAADSPLVQATQPVAPLVVVKPPAPPPGSGVVAPPARKYTGRLVGIDGWRDEPPGFFGTVVDANGRGVNGVRVVADKCDGSAVFGTNTDGNGAFALNGLYWHDTTRWCVRTVAPNDSEPFAVEVGPYKRYTVQFVPVQ